MPPRKRSSTRKQSSGKKVTGTRGTTRVAKGPTKKVATPISSQRVSVKKTANSVHIDFADPRQVLPHLLNLASDFAGKHFATATYTSAEDDVLGTAAARTIVSGCANSTCWNCTLGDLKLDSTLFQGCVYDGVQNAGYIIERDHIPASQDTQLFTVVISIQGAKRKG